MTDPESNAEASLRKLGQRLHEGWARRRVVNPELMQKVRATVREQWEKEQAQRQGPGPALGPSPTASQSPAASPETKPKDKSAGQDQSHDHDQSQ